MSAHGHSHDDNDFAHPLPVGMLLGVFVALVMLTILTVGQANFDFGSWDVAIVMFIATIKAILVMAIFMHLAFDKPFNVIVFASSFVFVALFVSFTLGDAKMTAGSLEPSVDETEPAVAEPTEIKVDAAP